MIHWYICPWDVTVIGNSIKRTCAILRHAQNVAGQPRKCAWLEILNNKCLVKADVDDATHATIMADADFVEVPNTPTLSTAQRNALRAFLQNEGYTTGEINAAGLSRGALLQLIASVRCVIGANAGRSGIVIRTPRRPATTPFSHFNRVPG